VKIGKGQDQSVFLRADQRVPFGTVALVVDELRQSGIEQISMVTEPLTGSR
jgi:biopolymer transport protein ExbD